MPKIDVVDSQGQATHAGFDSEPNHCPICKRTIEPVVSSKGYIGRKPLALRIAWKCPSKECGHAFMGVYRYTSDIAGLGPYFVLASLEPLSPTKVVRQENIAEVSPAYYNIKDDASAAEQYGLIHVAGPGYRKALEFLVKDYVTRDDRERLSAAVDAGDLEAQAAAQENVDAIEGRLLGAVIAESIADNDIREIAKRAAWIGNDETHYIRKWTEHDLQDLKNLVDLTEHFIDTRERARKYRAEMDRHRA